TFRRELDRSLLLPSKRYRSKLRADLVNAGVSARARSVASTKRFEGGAKSRSVIEEKELTPKIVGLICYRCARHDVSLRSVLPKSENRAGDLCARRLDPMTLIKNQRHTFEPQKCAQRG